LARERTGYAGQLRISVIGYLSDGGVRSSPILPLDVHYSSGERDQALKDGIQFAQNVAVEGNVTRVRVIVYDRGSNAAGSVTIPIKSVSPGDAR